MPYSRGRQSSSSSAGSYNTQSSMFSRSSGTSVATSTTVPDSTVSEFGGGGGGGGQSLPCEFVGYELCDIFFAPEDFNLWVDHIVSHHFRGKLPNQVVCWFCDRYLFDSERASDPYTNFEARMWHIRTHLLEEGATIDDIRPDHYLNGHLWHNKLITEQAYNSVCRWTEAPQGPRIFRHDEVPAPIAARNSRRQYQYDDPHEEERKHKRDRHKAKKGRKQVV
ncbi:hypothetical protein F4802DRAFT_596308 [Xylaria palmicola]|nr:hypothetical protein F4802DRAFT_596308 [Xylaria palmicola]